MSYVIILIIVTLTPSPNFQQGILYGEEEEVLEGSGGRKVEELLDNVKCNDWRVCWMAHSVPLDTLIVYTEYIDY